MSILTSTNTGLHRHELCIYNLESTIEKIITEIYCCKQYNAHYLVTFYFVLKSNASTIHEAVVNGKIDGFHTMELELQVDTALRDCLYVYHHYGKSKQLPGIDKFKNYIREQMRSNLMVQFEEKDAKLLPSDFYCFFCVNDILTNSSVVDNYIYMMLDIINDKVNLLLI